MCHVDFKLTYYYNRLKLYTAYKVVPAVNAVAVLLEKNDTHKCRKQDTALNLYHIYKLLFFMLFILNA